MEPALVFGQPSYPLRSDRVEAWVTRRGGHLGPLEFTLGSRRVSPLHVAPWAGEGAPGEPPIIEVLRGDFFCMPFGGNATPFSEERHPIHGETANEEWSLVEATDGRLVMELETHIRPGKVRKEISVRSGEAAVYQRHVVWTDGPMGFGHHAMLSFGPDETGRLSTSPIAYGQVYPFQFEDPVKGGYTSLRQGARFDALDRVPLATGGDADLTRYPAREGFEDLAMVYSRPGEALAWNACVLSSGYLWICLRDPQVLTGTVLWHSNGGRHYAPWSGRHRRVLGIEDVTSFFHTGLAESAEANEASQEGFVTHITLSASLPLDVRTVMAVAEVPPGFERVAEIRPVEGGVLAISDGGLEVLLALDATFVREPSLS